MGQQRAHMSERSGAVPTHGIRSTWHLGGQDTTGLWCCHGLEPPTLPGVECPSPTTCPSSSHVRNCAVAAPAQSTSPGQVLLEEGHLRADGDLPLLLLQWGRPRQWQLAPRHPAAEGWSLHLDQREGLEGLHFLPPGAPYPGGPARACQTHRTGHSGSSSPNTVGERRATWDLRPRRTRRVWRTISPLSIGPLSLHSCEMLFMTGFSLRES